VVLATVRIPPAGSGNSTTGSGNGLQIAYLDRRVLLGTQRLQVAAVCLP
jgi:hypothetical protein